jgi:trimethylamine--corrinoid protein Co-methyltransferase
MRPTVKLLAPELIDQILGEAFALLQDPGVRVHNADALVLLEEGGAAVDRANQIARIPEAVVRRALDTAPRAFDVYDLTGQPVVHYGGDQVQFDPGSAALAVLDAGTGRQRPPVTADIVRVV